MIEVTCYRTSDGVIHRDILAAKRHADKRYAEKLSAVVADAGNYVTVVDFIEMNMVEFVALQALRDDMDLTRCEEVE